MSAGAVRAGKVFVEVGADTKAFNSAMRGLATSVNDVGRELAGIGAKFAAIGGAAAGGMIAATVAFGSAGSALLDMSKKTGLSVESLSKLGFAAEQNGATLEDVSKGVINLNRSFAEASSGSKEATAAFARLGLSMAQISGMSPEERFRAIVGALAAIPDPAVRAALAMQLFGKAGVQLLPMIADGTAGLDEMARKAEELGIVMSTDSAKSANAFGSALTSMHRAVGAISNAIGSALAPTLTEIANILTINAAAIAKYINENKGLVLIALKVAAGVFATGVALTVVGNTMLGLTRGVQGLAQVFKIVASPIVITGKALYALHSGAMLVIRSLAGVGAAAASAFMTFARMALLASASVVSFAASAISGIATYLAGLAGATASTIVSAMSMAAAWLLPLAPFLLLAAAVAGAGALFYSFGGDIAGALAPVADLASTAGSSIATAFSGVVADASVVFGDLKATAVSTFGGISDAISSGDLAGAATMLWLGLTAGFLRGMAAIMSYVDPWLEGLQNAFGDIGTAVYTTWDSLWTTLAALTNTAGAVMMGAIDNIVNGIMAAFDNLVANIQIAWIRVTGFLSGAKDTEERVKAVKDKNEARAVEREAARPGIAGRTAKADKENKQARTESNDRVTAAEDANAQDRQDRADATKAADARRQEGVAAADAAVEGKRAELGANKDAMAVEGTVGSAKTVEDLRDLYAEVERLRAAGASAESLDRLTESIDNQALEVDKARAIEDQDTDAKKKAAEQTAADVAATPLGKTAEVVGSFSASGAGMGFGATTTTEKQLETLKAIHETLKKQEEGKVSA